MQLSEICPTYEQVKARFQKFWPEKGGLTYGQIDLYSNIYGTCSTALNRSMLSVITVVSIQT